MSVVERPAFNIVIEKAEPWYLMPTRKYLSTKLLPQGHGQLHSNMHMRQYLFEPHHLLLGVLADLEKIPYSRYFSGGGGAKFSWMLRFGDSW